MLRFGPRFGWSSGQMKPLCRFGTVASVRKAVQLGFLKYRKFFLAFQNRNKYRGVGS